MPELGPRIVALRERIALACERAHRPLDTVELLPVSKRQSPEAILAAQRAGFTTFGENYVQEGAAKALAFPELRFLLLGPLQKNKVKPALQHFQEILSVDRLELVQRMGRIAEDMGLTRAVWIQVDLWEEESKLGGCPENRIADLVLELKQWPSLPLKGFMAIPPPDCPEAFRQMAHLRQEWVDRLGSPLRLSMGMSDDLEAAISAGTDQIRIGTAFFGPRAKPDRGSPSKNPVSDNI